MKEEHENAGNTGNDQNARAEERSLADEQREQESGQRPIAKLHARHSNAKGALLYR